MLRKTTLWVIVTYLGLLDVIQTADLHYKPGELIVRFAADPKGKQLTIAERNAILASFDGGYVRHSYKIVPGLSVVKLPENMSVQRALEAFQSVGGYPVR